MCNNKPTIVKLTKGEEYYYCTCGKTKTAPFCDNKSHDGTGFTPVAVVADETGEEYWCNCKKTSSPPLCDGSHNKLT
jgi:methylamine---glutamate N-methyltransferase subunit C